MKEKFIPPERGLDAFNCPHCHVYAAHEWYYLRGSSGADGYGRIFENQDSFVSRCSRCNGSMIWFSDKIIYPLSGYLEPANLDLPGEIKADYEEAASILNLSPRGAAALLRLSIQKLCKHLGESGKDINNDIKNLVTKGLPHKVQEALDSVRVIGNEAVHPGTLDLKDDRATAAKLFKLLNFIATKLISEPKEIDEIYSALPADKLEGIKKRDKS